MVLSRMDSSANCRINYVFSIRTEEGLPDFYLKPACGAMTARTGPGTVLGEAEFSQPVGEAELGSHDQDGSPVFVRTLLLLAIIVLPSLTRRRGVTACGACETLL